MRPPMADLDALRAHWKHKSDGIVVLPPGVTFTPFPAPEDTRKSCTQEEHDACGCANRDSSL